MDPFGTLEHCSVMVGCIPSASQPGKVFGVLQVFNKACEQQFSEEDTFAFRLVLRDDVDRAGVQEMQHTVQRCKAQEQGAMLRASLWGSAALRTFLRWRRGFWVSGGVCKESQGVAIVLQRHICVYGG